MTEHAYPFTIRPLTDEEGGGFLIEFPDLPGCISDGETVEEAITMGKDAVECWIETAKAHGHPIPSPGSSYNNHYSGKFVQRIPKTLHRQLVQQAEHEHVSLNTLVLSYIAQGLGSSMHEQPYNNNKPC